MCAIWLPFADAFDAGLWLFWITETEILAVPRPAILVEGDRLHSATGPAVSWPSGERYYFWRGVQVPEDVVLRPEAITPARIDAEANAEVRRVMLERYGVARYLQDSGATLLDESRWGKLWRKEIPDDEPIVMVEVRNATPEPDGSTKTYFLRVHPECRPLLRDGLGEPQELTAHNAVASTFGKRGAVYHPEAET
jgi:hypothetical protein